jgi:hypothetical protein
MARRQSDNRDRKSRIASISAPKLTVRRLHPEAVFTETRSFVLGLTGRSNGAGHLAGLGTHTAGPKLPLLHKQFLTKSKRRLLTIL